MEDKKPRPLDAEAPKRAERRIRVLDAREDALGAREDALGAREDASSTREHSLTDREEVARLRDEALRAQEEVRSVAEERDRVMAQMRDANEALVLATMRADALADEARAARAEIAASEERFRTLVTTSAALVFHAHADGRMYMDPTSWRAFTRTQIPDRELDALAEGSELLALVHPTDRERVQEAWAHAVAAGASFALELRVMREDGSYGHMAMRAVPIPIPGPPREWIGTLTDVSDRVRIDEAREQFIAILGHDLRGPLSSVKIGAQLLAQAGLRERDADIVQRIERSARRMETMIGALLDFARGHLGGGIPITRASCDLASICTEAVSEARQANPGRTISCVSQGDTRGDWDRDRLEQLLSNLFVNAIVHGEDPIVAAARDEGDRVVLTVHNRGSAIEPSRLASLFKPFHGRAPGSKGGLGLGLYIASQIARAHAGTIGVQSTDHDGTSFTVELPRSQP